MLLELPHGKSHLPDPSDAGRGHKTSRALCGATPPPGATWSVFPDTTMHDIPDAQLCGRCRRKVQKASRAAREVTS